MPWFAPNVKRLHEHRDVGGLLKALHHGGTDPRTLGVRVAAAESLAGYPHLEVLRELMEIVGSGEGAPLSSPAHRLRSTALKSAQRMLYPHYQKTPELIGWWFAGPDRSDEVRQILAGAKSLRRDEAWRAACRRVDQSFGTPARIEGIMQRAIRDDAEASDDETAEAHRWMKEAEAQRAPLYEQARAELEAKWAAEDSAWAAQEAALLNPPASAGRR